MGHDLHHPTGRYGFCACRCENCLNPDRDAEKPCICPDCHCTPAPGGLMDIAKGGKYTVKDAPGAPVAEVLDVFPCGPSSRPGDLVVYMTDNDGYPYAERRRIFEAQFEAYSPEWEVGTVYRPRTASVTESFTVKDVDDTGRALGWLVYTENRGPYAFSQEADRIGSWTPDARTDG